MTELLDLYTRDGKPTGRIIERGSHDKLIADKGTYYKLYTGAFELE